MSTATARAGAAPERTRPAPKAPEKVRPDLRAVPPQPFRAPKGPFVFAVGAVLTLGLLGVLLLNTVVAQDAFTVSALQAKSAALADQQQALTQEVAAVESPERLDSRARRLGMVPSVNPLFLRLADGKVLGEPVAGKAPVRRVAAPTAVVPAAGSSPSATTAPTPGVTTAPTTPKSVRTKAAAALRTKAATTTKHTGTTSTTSKKKAGQ